MTASSFQDAIALPGLAASLNQFPIQKRRRPFVLRPKSLASYMAISAAASLYRRAQMRTCARCGSWFEFVRAHAQFWQSQLPVDLARQKEGVTMASVRKKKLSDDRIIFQAIWREGAGSKRRQRTKNFARHTEARSFAAKMESEVEARRVGHPNRATVAEYLENWLGLPRCAQRALRHHRRRLRRYVKLAIREVGAIPLERLTAQDL